MVTVQMYPTNYEPISEHVVTLRDKVIVHVKINSAVTQPLIDLLKTMTCDKLLEIMDENGNIYDMATISNYEQVCKKLISQHQIGTMYFLRTFAVSGLVGTASLAFYLSVRGSRKPFDKLIPGTKKIVKTCQTLKSRSNYLALLMVPIAFASTIYFPQAASLIEFFVGTSGVLLATCLTAFCKKH